MRSSFLVAVHIFFLRQEQILLLRRFNTGYEDGNYSVAAGHLEAGETVTQAALREAAEEVGVTLDPADIQIVHVMNRKSEIGRLEPDRVDFFLTVRRWSGEIHNAEPHKCDDLAWYPLDALPQNTVPYVRYAIQRFQAGGYYSEFGW
jgi:ADP-ribose pyrophosphatase YjhB (NUDIX family)